ncbi:MAG: hypothetical protein KKH88_03190 [Nanoarchaeota archaeon]|nr:hypothetical protein [Nanoarchaeota archaeon]MBU1445108.1 hypothetical protein [Nanoarchaeota archaeon]MBU2420363.1 hypothetical protein [Nanoarchaeota archaeon]MBU2474971.1 hypothetical protein [Nanoarchaeota archaeon]MBU3940901.1 hypothetical protein [Nanoarchaeota archaeon]
MADKKQIGKISHFFDKASVAVLDLEGTLKVGDKILIEMGDGSNFEMDVDSMQIEHEQIKVAKKGQSVGLKTPEPVKGHAKVYKV